MALKHILIKNNRLQGWEYGMLRALEEEIRVQTNAEVIELPDYGSSKILAKAGHGMRFENLRRWFPKKQLALNGDVLWYILMGPESYELDLFTGWEHIPNRIVYIYDTLPHQYPIIKTIFSGNAFNIPVTSFHDAIPDLNRITGKTWQGAGQAVPSDLFYPVDKEQKNIHFSSYGRRYPEFHKAMLDFCKSNRLYYDFTTHDGKHPTAPAEELYQQYAWHLRHSVFTISWPVEMTNPSRAGHLRPITCRWFEAAASGTIIAGRQPANPMFNELISPGVVVEINPDQSKPALFKMLDTLWENRDEYQKQAYAVAEARRSEMTWNSRVKQMLQFIK